MSDLHSSTEHHTPNNLQRILYWGTPICCTRSSWYWRETEFRNEFNNNL